MDFCRLWAIILPTLGGLGGHHGKKATTHPQTPAATRPKRLDACPQALGVYQGTETPKPPV